MASGRRVAKSATEGLKVLWEDKFFRAWRKKEAVVTEFAKRANHFPDAELGMALLRAGHLTRRGKRGSYEYIQKYPYVAEEEVKSSKKKAG
jgi:hypothetical protein